MRPSLLVSIPINGASTSVGDALFKQIEMSEAKTRFRTRLELVETPCGNYGDAESFALQPRNPNDNDPST